MLNMRRSEEVVLVRRRWAEEYRMQSLEVISAVLRVRTHLVMDQHSPT